MEAEETTALPAHPQSLSLDCTIWGSLLLHAPQKVQSLPNTILYIFVTCTMLCYSSPCLQITEKSGTCPIDRCRCSGPQPDECATDFGCSSKRKCCEYCCAKRCVDPKRVAWTSVPF
uniref:WAP domain-containing protein n=1 Tax=Salvator merianae TaxID=96440 RepID=A0A8D0DLZ5_SALMN